MRTPIIYKILRPLDKLYMMLYCPSIKGTENIPKKEACLLVANHTAKLDPLLIMACTNRWVSYLGKIELFKGIKKYFFKAVGVIAVDRKKSNPEALKNAISHLNRNGVIGIFPEGTINRTKDVIMPFKYGAVKMAKESGAWIVPVAITGKYRLFKKDIMIEFGKSYKVIGEIDDENKKLEKIVRKMIKENRDGRA